MGDPGAPTTHLLQSSAQAELLDHIDLLRGKGLSRFFSLPQLIVCGDQSSGKSSVLEAISKVAFPTNDGLCTRFVTEVSLRRTSRKAASVKILPAYGSSREHIDRLKSVNKSEVDLSKLPEVVEASKHAMGISGDSSFSQDILQLEISGPDLPHLTLVDMPGLIHSANKEQTQKDVDLVKFLVQKYMRSPRSIILAVVSAKYDLANQVVLQMAKSIDPDGLRTMGVITKPDTLHPQTPNERSFISLAKNQNIPFRLGWHVLRNADYADKMNPAFDRDETERLFFADRAQWNSLPRSNVGIDTLRTRLSKILFDQIKNELPGLVADMESEAEACRSILKKLGPARASSRDQLRYLMNFTERFQALARAGLNGHYSDPFFHPTDEKPSRRFRATIRGLSQQFASEMEMKGHSKSIGDPVPSSQPGRPIKITRKDFLKEIQELLKESKGRELPGTFNPLLIFDLFVQHAEPWKSIAKHHVEECWNAARCFVDDVVDHTMDAAAKNLLLHEVFDPAMEERFQKVDDKIDELLTPYTREFPATLNRQFIVVLQDLRKKRASEDDASEDDASDTENDDMDDFACSELLDCMLAYYQIARNVFVDNVEALAVENCLLRGIDEILSPTKITDMSSEELSKFGAESEESQQTRKETEDKLKTLQDGLDICKRHAKRVPVARIVPATKPAPASLGNDSGEPKSSPSSKAPVSSGNDSGEPKSSVFSKAPASFGNDSGEPKPSLFTKVPASFGNDSGEPKPSLFSKAPETKSLFGNISNTPKTNSSNTSSLFTPQKTTTPSFGAPTNKDEVSLFSLSSRNITNPRATSPAPQFGAPFPSSIFNGGKPGNMNPANAPVTLSEPVPLSGYTEEPGSHHGVRYTEQYKTIAAATPYLKWSTEELRVADYLKLKLI